jgi:hypothetical protein
MAILFTELLCLSYDKNILQRAGTIALRIDMELLESGIGK